MNRVQVPVQVVDYPGESECNWPAATVTNSSATAGTRNGHSTLDISVFVCTVTGGAGTPNTVGCTALYTPAGGVQGLTRDERYHQRRDQRRID
jgi:hypothetical protein